MPHNQRNTKALHARMLGALLVATVTTDAHAWRPDEMQYQWGADSQNCLRGDNTVVERSLCGYYYEKWHDRISADQNNRLDDMGEDVIQLEERLDELEDENLYDPYE